METVKRSQQHSIVFSGCEERYMAGDWDNGLFFTAEIPSI